MKKSLNMFYIVELVYGKLKNEFLNKCLNMFESELNKANFVSLIIHSAGFGIESEGLGHGVIFV